jgi:hypothetical protein
MLWRDLEVVMYVGMPTCRQKPQGYSPLITTLFSCFLYNPITAKITIINRTIDHLSTSQTPCHPVKTSQGLDSERLKPLGVADLNWDWPWSHATTPRRLVSPKYQNCTAVADPWRLFHCLLPRTHVCFDSSVVEQQAVSNIICILCSPQI